MFVDEVLREVLCALLVLKMPHILPALSCLKGAFKNKTSQDIFCMIPLFIKVKD